MAISNDSTGNDRPARIVNPDAASRSALQLAVNAALRTNVGLAADALTNSSVLTIERDLSGNSKGALAKGRNMDPPIQFRLVENAGTCILIDQRNAQRFVLADTHCVAE